MTLLLLLVETQRWALLLSRQHPLSWRLVVFVVFTMVVVIVVREAMPTAESPLAREAVSETSDERHLAPGNLVGGLSCSTCSCLVLLLKGSTWVWVWDTGEIRMKLSTFLDEHSEHNRIFKCLGWRWL